MKSVVKAVVDTNVVISGIFWSGIPGRVLEAWALELFTLCVSSSILDEYFEVIDRIGAKSNRPELARRWKAYLFEHCETVEAPHRFEACRDADDNKFVDCAVGAGATYVVSGDDDLLSLESIEHVQILKPADFLTRLNE